MIFLHLAFAQKSVVNAMRDRRSPLFEEILSLPPLDLKKSPRTPRMGTSGSVSLLTLSKVQKSGKQFELLPNCTVLERVFDTPPIRGEREIPQTLRAFRVIPRIERTRVEAQGTDSIQVKNPYRTTSNAGVKSRRTKDSETTISKGTKKAPRGQYPLNSQVLGVFLESFKSCRGHHFIPSSDATVWRVSASICRHLAPAPACSHFGPFRSTSDAFQGTKRHQKAPSTRQA